MGARSAMGATVRPKVRRCDGCDGASEGAVCDGSIRGVGEADVEGGVDCDVVPSSSALRFVASGEVAADQRFEWFARVVRRAGVSTSALPDTCSARGLGSKARLTANESSGLLQD